MSNEQNVLMLSVSGCRGIFGVTMTPETAARFGAAAAEHVRKVSGKARPTVVLGRDGRAGGEALMAAAGAGLMAGGCDCLEVGVAMTPTVAIFADVRGADAGIIITASHNPQQWNGLKLVARSARLGPGVVDACAPAKSDAESVIAIFKQAGRGEQPTSESNFSPLVIGVEPTQTGNLTRTSRGGLGVCDEATYAHVQVLRQALASIGISDDRAHMGVKCVVDSVNASGVAGSREFLGSRLVAHLGSGDSGIFSHAPEPIRENLSELCRVVKEKRADLGFAQDPDADRLAIVDERGEYIGEEYTLVLAAMALLGSGKIEARGATLCTNLSTSRMLEDVVERYGARVLRTAVGEANVVEAMKKYGAVLGGEGNGGVIWPRVTYIRDSLTAMGLTIGLLAREKKKLSEIVGEIPAYVIMKEKVDLPDLGVARRAVEAVARAFCRERIDRQDGVRVDFENIGEGGVKARAWVHVRASNTEPIMRLIAEAPTRGIAEQILARTREAIASG